MRALIFPGQGSQAVGMGQALADAYPAARAVLDEVDQTLGQNLSGLMRDGPADEINLTANAQPALMAVSVAALRVLQAELGLDLTRDVAFVAGHSLGEYSALVAAGCLGVGDAARLLRIRGEAMQRAVPVGQGAMAALLGLDREPVEAIAREAAQDQVCDVANDNGPGQVVVSGHAAAVQRAVSIAQGRGARRAVMLPVSAPFHCALMAPAADAMREALAGVAISAPAVPVVANIEAAPISDPEAIRDALVRQVTGTVRWRESVDRIARDGVDVFVEVGAGKVLAGLVKRIAPGAKATSFGQPGDLEAVRPLLTA
ncbi:ACP S-malonyltransferase [Enterovirga aerilata]|uniref:Malonyl CoA-acyl carrier protein transacylase n=1 Tax=Enterovirga aerilata TaxID=2730920 RepID=A0A849I9E1_9HYPH|nr:ACP S-malonyltransferase [Enterovirga sp. DB1703]NNM72617.1 ACP S-malonyltransferase [Enterovirga sp. DB1703]